MLVHVRPTELVSTEEKEEKDTRAALQEVLEVLFSEMSAGTAAGQDDAAVLRRPPT